MPAVADVTGEGGAVVVVGRDVVMGTDVLVGAVVRLEVVGLVVRVVEVEPPPGEAELVNGAENASSTTPLHAVLAFVRAFETDVFWAVVSVLSCTRAVLMFVSDELLSFASWVRALSTPCWASVTACWSCCFFTSVGPSLACA